MKISKLIKELSTMKELLGNIDVVLEDNKNLSSIKEVVYTFKNKKKVVTLLKYKMFPL